VNSKYIKGQITAVLILTISDINKYPPVQNILPAVILLLFLQQMFLKKISLLIW
jgi:hypothetical protein